ncbi:MAG: hypothetical protein ACLU4J_07250 [Butyricimonas paravirosa]
MVLKILFGVDLLYNNDDGVMKGSTGIEPGADFTWIIGLVLYGKNYVLFNTDSDSPQILLMGHFRIIPVNYPRDDVKMKTGYLDVTRRRGKEEERANPLYEAGLH